MGWQSVYRLIFLIQGQDQGSIMIENCWRNICAVLTVCLLYCWLADYILLYCDANQRYSTLNSTQLYKHSSLGYNQREKDPPVSNKDTSELKKIKTKILSFKQKYQVTNKFPQHKTTQYQIEIHSTKQRFPLPKKYIQYQTNIPSITKQS